MLVRSSKCDFSRTFNDQWKIGVFSTSNLPRFPSYNSRRLVAMEKRRCRQEEIPALNHILATTSSSTRRAMTMGSRNEGGRKASKRLQTTQRRLSRPFLWIPPLLAFLFCLDSSNAWYQYRPIQQRLRPPQRGIDEFAKRFGKSQKYCWQSSSISFPRSHTQAFVATKIQTNTSLMGLKNDNESNDSACSKMIHDQHGRKFGGGLRRKLLNSLLFLSLAGMLPASAFATTISTTTPPILTCPVSAAAEFRLMIRLVIAALIGAALGKERSFAKHSAGVRTMSLVSMGAAVFTVCSCYGFANFPKVDGTRCLILKSRTILSSLFTRQI